jgi:hypothetical protein
MHIIIHSYKKLEIDAYEVDREGEQRKGGRES